jgi:hypothetical protein
VAADVEAQLRYARTHLPAEVQRGDDGLWYLTWRYSTPEWWRPASVELVLQLPPAYPAQAPSGFDAVLPIAPESGAAMGGSGARPLLERACLHFCWNPQGAIDYAVEDGVWRFAKFAETRFLERQ